MTERASWRLGRRELRAMVIGVALYGILSWLTNVFHLQAADLQIRPSVAVPIVFGFIFGPVVGFVTGAVGNLTTDLMSGLLPYPPVQPIGFALVDFLRSYLFNWQIGNGIMGLIPGLAALSYRRYYTLKDQLRALPFAVLGIVVGIGLAAFTHPWVDLSVDLSTAYSSYFVPVVRVNLINALVLVPILLFNYERFDLRSTEWLRSGLMRQFLLAILVSAALPVAMLGLFLSQQASRPVANQTEVAVKLALTVVLTLLFTVANAGLLAQSISRPLLRLTKAARLMQEGNLNKKEASDLQATSATDELSRLSQMFGRMACEVITREENLRQQVQQLQIEIDQAKKAKQVAEITETELFQHLREEASRLRGRKGRG